MSEAWPVECSRCNGSGEIAVSNSTLRYICAGPVPDDARGVASATCDRCHGMGQVEEDCDE